MSIGNRLDNAFQTPDSPLKGIESLDYNASDLADTISEKLQQANQAQLNKEYGSLTRVSAIVRLTEVVKHDNGEYSYKGQEVSWKVSNTVANRNGETGGWLEEDYGYLFDSDCESCEANLVEIEGEGTCEVGDIVLATRSTDISITEGIWVFHKIEKQKQYFAKITKELDPDCGIYEAIQVRLDDTEEKCGYVELPASHVWKEFAENEEDRDPCNLGPLKHKDCKSGIPIGHVVLVYSVSVGECSTKDERRGQDNTGETSKEDEDYTAPYEWFFDENPRPTVRLDVDQSDGSYYGSEVINVNGRWLNGSNLGCEYDFMVFAGLNSLHEVLNIFGAEGNITEAYLVQSKNGKPAQWMVDLGGQFTTKVNLTKCENLYDWVQLERGKISSESTGVAAEEVNGQINLSTLNAIMTIQGVEGGTPRCFFNLKATDVQNAGDNSSSESSGEGTKELVIDLKECENPFIRKIKLLEEGNCITLDDTGDTIVINWDSSCEGSGGGSGGDGSSTDNCESKQFETDIDRDMFECFSLSCGKGPLFKGNTADDVFNQIDIWLRAQGVKACGQHDVKNIRGCWYGVACYGNFENRREDNDDNDDEDPDNPEPEGPVTPSDNNNDDNPDNDDADGGEENDNKGGEEGRKNKKTVQPIECRCNGKYNQVTGYGGTALDASLAATSKYKAEKEKDPDITVCSQVAGILNVNSKGPADKFVSAMCYTDGRGNTPSECPDVDFPKCRSSKCTSVIGIGPTLASANKSAWAQLRAETNGKAWGSCSSNVEGVTRGTIDTFVSRCRQYRPKGDTKFQTCCQVKFCFRIIDEEYPDYTYDCDQCGESGQPDCKACQCECTSSESLKVVGPSRDNDTDGQIAAQFAYEEAYDKPPCKLVLWRKAKGSLQLGTKSAFQFMACGDEEAKSPVVKTDNEPVNNSCENSCGSGYNVSAPIPLSGTTEVEMKASARQAKEFFKRQKTQCPDGEFIEVCGETYTKENERWWVTFCWQCSPRESFYEKYPEGDCDCGSGLDSSNGSGGNSLQGGSPAEESSVGCDCDDDDCTGSDEPSQGPQDDSDPEECKDPFREITKPNYDNCDFVKFDACVSSEGKVAKCLIVHKDRPAAKMRFIRVAIPNEYGGEDTLCYSNAGPCCAEKESDWIKDKGVLAFEARGCICNIERYPYDVNQPKDSCNCGSKRGTFFFDTQAEAKDEADKYNPCSSPEMWVPCSAPVVSKASTTDGWVVTVCGDCIAGYGDLIDAVEGSKTQTGGDFGGNDCLCGSTSQEIVITMNSEDPEEIEQHKAALLFSRDFYCIGSRNPNKTGGVKPCSVEFIKSYETSKGIQTGSATVGVFKVCYDCGYGEGQLPIDEGYFPEEAIDSTCNCDVNVYTSDGTWEPFEAGTLNEYEVEVEYGNIYAAVGENVDVVVKQYNSFDAEISSTNLTTQQVERLHAKNYGVRFKELINIDASAVKICFIATSFNGCVCKSCYEVNIYQTVSLDITEECADICLTEGKATLNFNIDGSADSANKYVNVKGYINSSPTDIVGDTILKLDGSGLGQGSVEFYSGINKALLQEGTLMLEASILGENSKAEGDIVEVCCSTLDDNTKTTSCAYDPKSITVSLKYYCYEAIKTSGGNLNQLMIEPEWLTEHYDLEIIESTHAIEIDNGGAINYIGTGQLQCETIIFTVRLTDSCDNSVDHAFSILPCEDCLAGTTPSPATTTTLSPNNSWEYINCLGASDGANDTTGGVNSEAVSHRYIACDETIELQSIYLVDFVGPYVSYNGQCYDYLGLANAHPTVLAKDTDKPLGSGCDCAVTP